MLSSDLSLQGKLTVLFAICLAQVQIPTHCSIQRLIFTPDVAEKLCHRAVHSTVYFPQCYAAQAGHCRGATTLLWDLELRTMWHSRGPWQGW